MGLNCIAMKKDRTEIEVGLNWIALSKLLTDRQTERSDFIYIYVGITEQQNRSES